MAAMGGPVHATELAAIEDVLRTQWLRLRRWLGELEEPDLARPSLLGDWTVADLVAHVGRSMDALAVSQPTAPGTVPLSLGDYVATYRPRAERIDRITHELSTEIAEDRLGAVDRMAEDAFGQLAVLRDVGADPVVQGRGGPLHLSDLLVSRVLELVVHGDDLARSLDRPTTGDQGPVDDRALRLVAEALLEAASRRGGWSLEVVDPLPWVRLACGRVPHDVDVLAGAVRPLHTSDSVPDLGTVLPLL